MRFGPKMETVPLEMLVEISRLLTPQDLARCCSVCRSWREIFNQHWLWKPHCNPALVKPLDSTPCVVEPVFVSPKSETSTLTPISRWRLAFLKQHHLWKNWKQRKYRKGKIFELGNEVQTHFLSNNLLVGQYKDRIEIWDVSLIPAAFVAKVDLESVDYCSVFGTRGLLVKCNRSVKILHVDLLNKHVIQLKHTIILDDEESGSQYDNGQVNLVKKSFYVYVDPSGISLHIIDLEKGKKVKKTTCPVGMDECRKAKIIGIKSSSTSNNVIVYVHVPWNEEKDKYHCYIYSLDQLMFLPGPVHKHWSACTDYFAIHRDYLAVGDKLSFIVYNCLTSECLFSKNFNSNICPDTFNNSFIFTAEDDNGHEGVIGMYSPTNETLKIVFQHQVIHEPGTSLRITNDKFVTILGDDSDDEDNIGVWEASGHTMKRTDLPAVHDHDINQAFTRGIGYEKPDGLYVYYYW